MDRRPRGEEVKKYASMYERLVANTEVVGDCWLWTGRVTGPYSYPKINVYRAGKHQTVRAHRAMLEETTGWHFPFDEAGHYVCMTPRCIAPHHLRIETPHENLSARRGYSECEGRMIPVLFPTDARLLQEAADWAWDTPGESGGCPF